MINIYTPKEPHGKGSIKGDRQTLERLKRCIEIALSRSTGQSSFTSFDSNGEEYEIEVIATLDKSVDAPYLCKDFHQNP